MDKHGKLYQELREILNPLRARFFFEKQISFLSCNMLRLKILIHLTCTCLFFSVTVSHPMNMIRRKYAFIPQPAQVFWPCCVDLQAYLSSLVLINLFICLQACQKESQRMLPVTIGVPRTSQVRNKSTKNPGNYCLQLTKKIQEILINKCRNLIWIFTIVRRKNLGDIKSSKH